MSSCVHSFARILLAKLLPNRRLKLPARGGRSSRELPSLIAAAAGRSLSASR